MAKNIEQPALSFEQALMMVTEDKKESVQLRGKTVNMGDLKKGALLKVTDLMVTLDENDPKKSCKCAAAITCNSWWQIKAFFGIGQQEMTLEEIGDQENLTRERVRQIKEKAIKKIRQNKNCLPTLGAYLGN